MAELTRPDSTQPVLYKIENLTINNYGTVNLLCDDPSHLKQSNAVVASGSAGDVEASATRREAFVKFKNNFPIKVDSVTIKHQYGGEPENVRTWTNIEPGQTTSDHLVCPFWTGTLKTDTWKLEITMPGNVKKESMSKDCMLRTEDANDNGGPLVFEIEDCLFKIAARSGICRAEFGGSLGWVFLRVQNKFERQAVSNVKLEHKYGTGGLFGPIGFGNLAPGQISYMQVVYYYWGWDSPGMDDWKASMNLKDVVKPKNAPPMLNSTLELERQFQWILTRSLRQKELTFWFDGAGFHFEKAEDEGVMDWIRWKTPLKRNTLCWVAIKNNFKQDISKVNLFHQYGDDFRDEYEYEYPAIAAGQTSTDVRMIEYKNGPGEIDYDFWTIQVTLKDGSRYQNGRKKKQCYLERKDAKIITFEVSETKFHLGLDGACDDSMGKMSLMAPGEKDIDDDWVSSETAL